MLQLSALPSRAVAQWRSRVFETGGAMMILLIRLMRLYAIEGEREIHCFLDSVCRFLDGLMPSLDSAVGL